MSANPTAPAPGVLPRPARVRIKPLTALAELLPTPRWGGGFPQGVTVSGITHDSRVVRPGDIYAALPGTRVHGAQFAAAAAGLGAAAVLTDEAGAERAGASGLPVLVVNDARAVLGTAAVWAYDEPAKDIALVGITGTNGKTTTAYLVEAGLRAAGHTTGLIGTVETRVAGDALPSVRTTPEATDLQALFAVMRESGVTAAAMEVSSHALALGRVDGTHYQVAVFTNLSQDHLDFHADMDDYFAAKASLFAPERAARAVVNVDDPYGARLAAATTVPTTTVSPSGRSAADWRAVASDHGWDESSVRLAGPGGVQVALTVRLPGAFNLANATCAYAALLGVGVAPARAAAGIGALRAVPGRMERVEAGQPYLALVDYAHTPQAVQTLLDQLREVAPRARVLLVLGCGGDRDAAKRPMMGRYGACADLFVVTDDNPRSEDPAAIRAAMLAGVATVPVRERGEVVEIGDRRAAIAEAVARAGTGDVVVIAGKGHEQGQEIAGRLLPFDDRAVLRAAIEAGA